MGTQESLFLQCLTWSGVPERCSELPCGQRAHEFAPVDFLLWARPPRCSCTLTLTPGVSVHLRWRTVALGKEWQLSSTISGEGTGKSAPLSRVCCPPSLSHHHWLLSVLDDRISLGKRRPWDQEKGHYWDGIRGIETRL